MQPFQEENFSVISGEIFQGIISYVGDFETLCVVKKESSIVLEELHEHLEKNPPQKMFWYPAFNEKFLLHESGEYFRAIRVVNSTAEEYDSNEYMQAVLIDYGDTCLIPINTHNLEIMDSLFMMPDEFVNVPGIAIRCNWMCSDKSNDEKYTFMKDNWLKKLLTFECVKVSAKAGTATVKIYPFEDQNANSNTKHLLEKPVLTKEEIEELYEEPLGTESALVAVHGYATKDDERLCQFYDPKTGGCFKGGSCKLKHLPLSADPYECRDRMEIFVRKTNYDNLKPNQTYRIEVISFMRINQIIFRFFDPKFDEKLNKIEEALNSPAEIKNYKKLSFHPAVNELVLVKIRGKFLRAKVVNEVDESYAVWCLDVGRLQTVKDDVLYEWVYRFKEFEYLTHELEIINISPLRSNQKQAMLRIVEIQEKTGYVLARFEEIGLELKGRLYDNKMNDIGDMLIANGLAIKNTFKYSEFMAI